ncbi:MAG: thioredoxin domain-containing protein [Bacteroidetes bacterium]|nr:thioredoxin domain-containing protein [Bacteroidota bacterium]
MKQIKIFLSIIITGILLVSCSSNKKTSGSQLLTATDFHKKIKEEKNIQIIDVRTAEELATGYIQDAINIDYNAGDFEKEILKLDKSKPTFVYCKAGGRSKEAAEILVKNGFTVVYDLKGGIMSWQNNNLPIVTTTKVQPKVIESSIENAKNTKVFKTENLSVEDFKDITTQSKIVIIDFNAVWCGPCKRLTPILDALEKQYGNKIKIVKVDVDKNKFISDYFRIESIPLLHFYKNGKLVNQIEGLPTEANLKYNFEKLIK